MTKKQKLIFQLIGLVIIMLVSLFPLLNKLNGSLATRKALTQKLITLETKLNVLNGIEQELIDDRVKKMEAVFPSVKPIVTLMSSLSRLAAEYNLEFGGVSLSPGSLSLADSKGTKAKKSDAGLNDLSFGFQISGEFDSISQFMQALENTAPLMKIEEVGINIKTNPLFEREATLVVANIKVAAYYQAPPKTIGSIEKPVKLLTKNDENLLNKLVAFRVFPAIVPQSTAGKENLFGAEFLEVQPE